ncbi:MAG: hypothetical protein DCF12_03130 [Snowella sp.]|jgi:hypothetical protein|nr:MAG: hypothetical protein DCF12_03130 [Snowella sp.]
MNSDYDIYANKDLFAPVVFRSEFNSFKPISGNEAWSLFFTGGQEDKELGINPETGRFFTNTLTAIAVVGIVWAFCFSHPQLFGFAHTPFIG